MWKGKLGGVALDVVTTQELKALDIDGDGKLSKVRISLSIFDCV